MADTSHFGKKSATKIRISTALGPDTARNRVSECRKSISDKSDYKRKHTIGRRRAVSRVVTYDESVPLYEAFVRAAELRENESEIMRGAKSIGTLSTTPGLSLSAAHHPVHENHRERDTAGARNTKAKTKLETKTKKSLCVSPESSRSLSRWIAKKMKNEKSKSSPSKSKNISSVGETRKRKGRKTQKESPKKSSSPLSLSKPSSRRMCSLRTKSMPETSSGDNLIEFNHGKKLSVCLIRLKREASLNAAAKVNLIYNESLQYSSSSSCSNSKWTTQTHALGSASGCYSQPKKRHKGKTENNTNVSVLKKCNLAATEKSAITTTSRSCSPRKRKAAMNKRNKEQHVTPFTTGRNIKAIKKTDRNKKRVLSMHVSKKRMINRVNKSEMNKSSSSPSKKSSLYECRTMRSTPRQKQPARSAEKKSKLLEIQNDVTPVPSSPIPISKKRNIHLLPSDVKNISCIPMSKKRNLELQSTSKLLPSDVKKISTVPIPKNHNIQFQTSSSSLSSCGKNCIACHLRTGVRMDKYQTGCENKRRKMSSGDEKCQETCIACHLGPQVGLEEYQQKGNTTIDGQCEENCIACHFRARVGLGEYQIRCESETKECKVNINDDDCQKNCVTCDLGAEYQIGCETNNERQCRANCLSCNFKAGLEKYKVVGCETETDAEQGKRSSDENLEAVVGDTCPFLPNSNNNYNKKSTTATPKNCTAALENSVTVMRCCHHHQHHHHHHHHHHKQQEQHLTSSESLKRFRCQNQNPNEAQNKKGALKKLKYNDDIDEDLDVVIIPEVNVNPAVNYMNLNHKNNSCLRALKKNLTSEKIPNENRSHKKSADFEIIDVVGFTSDNDSSSPDYESSNTFKSEKLTNERHNKHLGIATTAPLSTSTNDTSHSDYQNLKSNFKFEKLPNDNSGDNTKKIPALGIPVGTLSETPRSDYKTLKTNFKYEKLPNDRNSKTFGTAILPTVASSVLSNNNSSCSDFQNIKNFKSNDRNNEHLGCVAASALAKDLHFNHQTLNSIGNDNNNDDLVFPGKRMSTVDATEVYLKKRCHNLKAPIGDVHFSSSGGSANDSRSNYQNRNLIGNKDNDNDNLVFPVKKTISTDTTNVCLKKRCHNLKTSIGTIGNDTNIDNLVFPGKRSAMAAATQVYLKKKCQNLETSIGTTGNMHFTSNSTATTTSIGLCKNNHYCSSSCSSSSSSSSSSTQNAHISGSAGCKELLYCSADVVNVCCQANCHQNHSSISENSLRKASQRIASFRNTQQVYEKDMVIGDLPPQNKSRKFKLSKSITSFDNKQAYEKHSKSEELSQRKLGKFELSKGITSFNPQTCDKHSKMEELPQRKLGKNDLSKRNANFNQEDCKKHAMIESPLRKSGKVSQKIASLNLKPQSCKKPLMIERSARKSNKVSQKITSLNFKTQPCKKPSMIEKSARKSCKVSQRISNLNLKAGSCKKSSMMEKSLPSKVSKRIASCLKAQSCERYSIMEKSLPTKVSKRIASCHLKQQAWNKYPLLEKSLPSKVSKRIASLNAQAIMDVCQESRYSKRDIGQKQLRQQNSQRAARTHYIFNPKRQSCRWVNGLGMNNMGNSEHSNDTNDIATTQQKVLVSSVASDASNTNTTIIAGSTTSMKRSKNNNTNNTSNKDIEVENDILVPSDSIQIQMKSKINNTSFETSSKTANLNSAASVSSNPSASSAASTMSPSMFSNFSNVIPPPNSSPVLEPPEMNTAASCSSLPYHVGGVAATAGGNRGEDSGYPQCQTFTLRGIGSISNLTSLPYHHQPYGNGPFTVPCSHYGYYNSSYCAHSPPMVAQIAPPQTCVLTHPLPIHVPHAEVKVLIHNPLPGQPFMQQTTTPTSSAITTDSLQQKKRKRPGSSATQKRKKPSSSLLPLTGKTKTGDAGVSVGVLPLTGKTKTGDIVVSVGSETSEHLRKSDSKRQKKKNLNTTVNIDKKVNIHFKKNIKQTMSSKHKPKKTNICDCDVKDIKGAPLEKIEKNNSSLLSKKKKPSSSSWGWSWQGLPEIKAVPNVAVDEPPVERKCYPAIKHTDGEVIYVRDCVLLKSGPRKKDVPFTAKVMEFWENTVDGEMMMNLLWYYRPEHTDSGRNQNHVECEVFASKHRDVNSVACIEDKCYVLTFNEYCRYKAEVRRTEANFPARRKVVPTLKEEYPRHGRLPPLDANPETVFLCRQVYQFRQKRILKKPA